MVQRCEGNNVPVSGRPDAETHFETRGGRVESLLCRPSKHCKIGPEQMKILASLEAREQTNVTFIDLIFCIVFLRLVATFLKGNQISPLLRNN